MDIRTQVAKELLVALLGSPALVHFLGYPGQIRLRWSPVLTGPAALVTSMYALADELLRHMPAPETHQKAEQAAAYHAQRAVDIFCNGEPAMPPAFAPSVVEASPEAVDEAKESAVGDEASRELAAVHLLCAVLRARKQGVDVRAVLAEVGETSAADAEQRDEQ